MLQAPGIQRLKLEQDEPLSNFAFKFKLRHYTVGAGERRGRRAVERGRGLHSSTFMLNLSRLCH